LDNIEEIVLGCFLGSGSLEEKADALSYLTSDMFRDQDHRLVFSAIQSLIAERQNPDTITVFNVTKLKKKLGRWSYDSEMSGYSITNMADHARILRQRKYFFNAKEIMEGVQNDLEDSRGFTALEDTVNKAIASLSGLDVENENTFVKTEEIAEKIFEQMNSGKRIEGFSWGVNGLDSYTSGLITKRLYVLAGLKKGGKTRLMINTLKHLHDQRVPAGVIELEVPEYEFTKMLYSRFAEVNDAYLRSAQYVSAEEMSRLHNIDINHGYFGIECRAGLSDEQVLSRIRRMAKMGYRVIFIDFLQRMKYDNRNEAQELARICNNIADASRLYDVSIVLLSQYNAMGERELPNMSHLKGSGGIGEAADCILLIDNLYRRLKDDSLKGQLDVYVEQRYGDSGMVKLNAELGKSLITDRYE
jgi:replicative DNA helicase